jgi:Flp pilus assembly protein CpaB
MRRGRIFIYLALIVLIGVAGAGYYLWKTTMATPPGGTGTESTPELRYVDIVTAGQNIYPGAPITDAMLSTIQIPENNLVQGLFTSKSDLVNMYALYMIAQGIPITDSMVSITPGNVNLPGSIWAPFIPQGLTAVSVPISRFSSMAFGIRDGDYVNVIVSVLLVDVDPISQSANPNRLANIDVSDTGGLTISNSEVIEGHFEIDEFSQLLLYIQPSETQRPRLVSQMIMQNIQVLHVGTFPLPGEPVSDTLIASSLGSGATPTPAAPEEQALVTISKPDIMTLMVSPQDAVLLTYLVYSGAQITMTLRNPNDQDPAPQPDAAMLEYLLTQYNIPIPAKLPYALEPRVNQLTSPRLNNDATATPSR